MKRTNLMLPEDLLEEVVKLSGEKTYSKAVELACESSSGGSRQGVSWNFKVPVRGAAT